VLDENISDGLMCGKWCRMFRLISMKLYIFDQYMLKKEVAAKSPGRIIRGRVIGKYSGPIKWLRTYKISAQYTPHDYWRIIRRPDNPGQDYWQIYGPSKIGEVLKG
jgi:hypothetical protein